MPPPSSEHRLAAPWVRAELLATVWELFSAMLFVSAVLPVGFANPWPALLIAASLAISTLVSGALNRRGEVGYNLAALIRVAAWTLALLPLLSAMGPRVLVASFAFGLMSGAVRRSVYRRAGEQDRDPPSARVLRKTLRRKVAESAVIAGIVGGQTLLLFAAAFLRTQSSVLFHAWWELLPPMAVASTLSFSLLIRPLTARLVAALEAGEQGDPRLLHAGLRQAEALAVTLSRVNFASWFLCTTIGVFYLRLGPKTWVWGDAFMQIGICALFAWGVSSYQRAWNQDATKPAIALLRRWTGQRPAVDDRRIRERMLRDFGAPLVFTASLSLVSSIGLYRALGSNLSAREDFNAVSALVAAFTMLVIAAGGIVVRAARELSSPMSRLARAADAVASGHLEAQVPDVGGPVELAQLRDSVEDMRAGLAQTIEALRLERAGLEANVEARTRELQNALDELRRTQAALIHGERLAMVGELVAGLAHEIHNPLNAIAGASESLGEAVGEVRGMLAAYEEAAPSLPEAERQRLERTRESLDFEATLDDLTGISEVIGRGIRRSVAIVQNLKNFARASEDACPVDLHAGLDETLMLLGPRLRQAGIHVARELGELPLVVCHGGEVNQVFMNLLSNSIQALEGAPPGDRRITIGTRVDGERAIVTVDDNGPGVAHSIRRRIFAPFFTTKLRGEGTGLGLSISAQIAHRHGGSLDLVARSGQGACFALSLPLGRDGVRTSEPVVDRDSLAP